MCVSVTCVLLVARSVSGSPPPPPPCVLPAVANDRHVRLARESYILIGVHGLAKLRRSGSTNYYQL